MKKRLQNLLICGMLASLVVVSPAYSVLAEENTDLDYTTEIQEESVQEESMEEEASQEDLAVEDDENDVEINDEETDDSLETDIEGENKETVDSVELETIDEDTVFTCELSATTFKYTGNTQKPSVKVYLEDGTRLSKEYYDITYPKKSKTSGRYVLKVTLKNGYSGSKKAVYYIKPSGKSIKTVYSYKVNQVTVSWKAAACEPTGYQIAYSKSEDFSNAKTVTVKGSTKTEKTIKNLSGGKVYYFRLRTYTKTSDNTMYSGWSKTIKKAVKSKAKFRVSSKTLTLKASSKKLYITYQYSKGSIWFHKNSDIIKCKWDGKWDENGDYITITPQMPGTTYVTFTNTINSKKIKVKVTVKPDPGTLKWTSASREKVLDYIEDGEDELDLANAYSSYIYKMDSLYNAQTYFKKAYNIVRYMKKIETDNGTILSELEDTLNDIDEAIDVDYNGSLGKERFNVATALAARDGALVGMDAILYIAPN